MKIKIFNERHSLWGEVVLVTAYISIQGGGMGGAAAPPVGKTTVLFGQN